MLLPEQLLTCSQALVLHLRCFLFCFKDTECWHWTGILFWEMTEWAWPQTDGAVNPRVRQHCSLYCFLLLLLLTDSCVPDFSRSFIAVKPGLQPVLLVGVDGEAPSLSSAFPGAEFLFALMPHSLLCLFVQIKRSVNNPGSYLFMAVLFAINWAGKGGGCPDFPPLVPSWLLPCF